MKNPIRISKTLALPLSFITSTQGIVAKKRRGKSYLAQVQAEELLKLEQQIVVLDPTGAWWGLRAGADGKGGGYPVTIFGGDHGDVPLESTAGDELASAIVDEGFSAVIDLTHLRKGERLRFAADFMETLYRRNRKAMHLFIDEADVFAPQVPRDPQQTKLLGATDELVRRGGIRGIGVTLISQRPQVVNKDVLSQIDMLMVLQMNHPKDLRAIEDWVVDHVDKDRAREMMASLPSLPIGAAWVWAPEAELFERFTVRHKETFDSGRTPKPGERMIAPKVLAPVDIERLGAAMAATVERAKANDPAALRARVAFCNARISELERLAAKPPKDAKLVTREVSMVKPADLKRLETTAKRLVTRADALELTVSRLGVEITTIKEVANRITQFHARMSAPAPATVIRFPGVASKSIANQIADREIEARRVATGDGKIVAGLRRIMIALAQRGRALTHRQIGVRAGISTKGGTFSTYMSRAKMNGWIVREGDQHAITHAGLAALGHYDPLPTGRALADYWLRDLGGGAARILQVLIDAYPNRVDAKTIGDRAQVSSAGGTFSTYVSRLRGLELVEGRGELSASSELFE